MTFLLSSSTFAGSVPGLSWVVVLTLLCVIIGCDHRPTPGQELFAMKNPTRRWKVPKQTRRDPLSSSSSISSKLSPKLKTKASVDVRSAIAVDPPVLFSERVRPDKPTEVETVLTSQRWSNFELEVLDCTLAGTTWEFRPADRRVLKMLGAKSGWRFRATLPAGINPGELQQALTVRVQPSDDDLPSRELTIPIRGHVLRRLAVYGEGIDESGTIDFGIVPAGEEHRRQFVVKVHDQQSVLTIREMRVDPDFVKVDLQPYDGQQNLYRMAVTLPATAPKSVYRGQRLGTIHIDFEHPRIQQLDLKVKFVLHGRQVGSIAHAGR